jgi:hypothetical protein
MQDNFRRGLKYHEEGKSGDGIRPQTVREARQAVEEGDLPDNKPKRMAAWFARHMTDLDTAPKRGDADYPSPGQVAHMLWGGGASKSVSERAMRWAERTAARLEREGKASAIIDSMASVDASDLGYKGPKDDEEKDEEMISVVSDDEEIEDEEIEDDEIVINDFQDSLPRRAVIVVATEGEVTSDGRVADPGSLSWRTPPLSLTVNHDPDQRAGRIDRFMRVMSLDGVTVDSVDVSQGDGTGPILVASVTFNLETDFGRMVAAEVRDGFLTGVSMEVGDEVIEYDDEDVMHLVEGRIGAVTLAPFQAIESARVVQVASIHVWEGPDTLLEAAHDSLVASSVPTQPPASWFSDPAFEGPAAITVTPDGQVFGHLALWGTCHTGRTDVCVTAPTSKSEYAYYRTGYVTTDTGDQIAVGPITMATSHASTRPGISAAAAVAHYEHTGFVVADVSAGEDAFGIWVAGALRPGVSAERVREFRGASLSGDWRSIGGSLELVAALAVNVPGFPVPRVQAGLTASGVQSALVAAGAFDGDCDCGKEDSYASRIAKLEAIAEILGLADQATERLFSRINK